LRRFFMDAFTDPDFVESLARFLLAGPWLLRFALRDLAFTFRDDAPLVTSMAQKAFKHFDARPSRRALLSFLEKTIAKEPHVPNAREVDLRREPMTPRWPTRPLDSPGQVANWLDLPMPRLEWLADIKGWTLKQPDEKLRHYVTMRLPRRRGKARLLEIPKPTLKAVQRRILNEILNAIPPHPASHGFRKGHSIVDYATPHVGQRIVLRFDLRDFFASVTAARVRAIFRGAGYPANVARILAALCTTRTPDDVPADDAWRCRHLPQGAPSSPALANLAAYRLDVRLHALARKLDAEYTRYADDLAFSGERRLERAAKRVQVLVAVIAAEEGFALHFQKSRFMRQGVRQQLAGVVVNARLNVGRDDYDLLKAILCNCVRHGPTTQNRAGHADFRRHLQGRIAHVKMLNPHRAAKLQFLFDRVDWSGC
jgi:hypothetical protein